MRNLSKAALVAAGVISTSLAFGQQNYNDNRYNYDRRDQRSYDRQSERQYNEAIDDRRDYNRRESDNPRYDNRYQSRIGDNRTFDERDLSRAYDQGFEDGQRSQVVSERQERHQNYKHFTFGLYGGINSSRFQGETIDTKNPTGRLGYQLGFFVRGGGRIYGQIGVEYLTSSSQFYTSDSTVSAKKIIANIDQRYLQVPAYIGVKLAQSDRGVSGIRLAIGAEYATPLSTDKNDFSLTNSNFQAATINGLANLGFDAGPIMLDFVYHYGFADVTTAGNSKRRILGINLGIKF